MPFMGALIGGGLGLLGSSMSSNSASNAAAQSSAAQVEAAKIAAEAAKFKPIGTTTRFGSSQFGYDPSGNLTSAGYTMSPELLAQQNQLMTGAGAALPQAGMNAQAGQGMFNLGQQFMPSSTGYNASPESQAYASQLRGLSSQILPSSYDTTAAAQQYMQQQQGLLQPGRDQAYAGMQQQLQNSGRGGFSIAQGGNLGAANPEMQAYYNSIAQQDASLAANAQQIARSNLQGDITFGSNLAGNALTSQQNAEAIARQNMLGNISTGTGLMNSGIGLQSSAYNPYQTQFGLAQTLESAAQNPLDISSAMAGRTTAANQAGASGMLAAQNAAANLNYKANASSGLGAGLTGLAGNQQLMGGLGNWLNPTPVQDQGYSVGQGPAYAGNYDGGMWAPNRQGM